ncbi:DUF4229 domain-containing protein [Mobilicoccus sp.]|uniref:DUF4229 domain-containing protein n=1 Tax=Mobilicoccus sp. TaxID=2034349 RepID=UPI0028A75209|nr:DUF4229 domain-containing protein [Mobilicoccus sp.]
MSYTFRYSLLRILIFVACLVLFRLMGLQNPLLLLLAATTVAMLISVFALDGMRDHMSEEIVERSARRREAGEAAHDGDEGPVVDGTETGTDMSAAPEATRGRRRRNGVVPPVTDEDVEDQAFR